MLLDTVVGLRALKEELRLFISSSKQQASFEAETSGDPAPYTEFLSGIRIQKSEGESKLRLTEENWLELCAGKEELDKFESQLALENDGDHHHWYGTPISLIIEVDESWPGWDES